jgi:hypothetical protein
MKRTFLLTLFLSAGAGCAGAVAPGVPTTDAGPDAAAPTDAAAAPMDASAHTDASPTDGGASADGGHECNSLVNNAPAVNFGCPGTCTVCTPAATGGGTIQDGTYFLIGGDVYASACGILQSRASMGKVVIHGSMLDYVYYGPINFSGGPDGLGTLRESYMFTTANGKITLTPVCPSGSPFTGDYMANGNRLAIPIGPWGSPPYFQRQ